MNREPTSAVTGRWPSGNGWARWRALNLQYRAAVQRFLPIALGAASGTVAWGHGEAPLAAVLLLPLIWRWAPSRWIVYAAFIAYYLGAARGLAIGATVFYGDQAPFFIGAVFWIASAMLLAAPWGLTWKARGEGSLWRLPLAVVLVAIPPIGLIGWTNPLAVGGLLFPGLGWFALAGTVVLFVLIVRRPALVVPLAGAAVAMALVSEAPQAPAGWRGVDTRFGGLGANEQAVNPLREYETHQKLKRLARSAGGGEVLVFPELVGGHWNVAASDLWHETLAVLASRGASIILGAERAVGSTRLENIALVLGASTATLHQRLPVPISMYRPWSETGYEARWFGREIAALGPERVAVIICYEQLLPWPLALAMLDRPTVLAGIANDYWARDTSIPAIQALHLRAWARMFGTRLVTATNY